MLPSNLRSVVGSGGRLPAQQLDPVEVGEGGGGPGAFASARKMRSRLLCSDWAVKESLLVHVVTLPGFEIRRDLKLGSPAVLVSGV